MAFVGRAGRTAGGGSSSWASAPAGWRCRSPSAGPAGRRPRHQHRDARAAAPAPTQRAASRSPSATWSRTSPTDGSTSSSSPTTRCSTSSPRNARRPASPPLPPDLATGGRFVVEAFVPEHPPPAGTVVTVRSMTVDEVVLSISDHDPAAQRAAGHLVQFADGARCRLRPGPSATAAPAELDALRRRGAGWRSSGGGRTSRPVRPVRRHSTSARAHVSVYGPRRDHVTIEHENACSHAVVAVEGPRSSSSWS